jgi:hypothetical protein
MRLLNVRSLEFKDFYSSDVPPYAILSHRWGEDEALYKDILKRRNTETLGYQKIHGFARYLQIYYPHTQWLWADSCCLKQGDSSEVSEAVNSMFD